MTADVAPGSGIFRLRDGVARVARSGGMLLVSQNDGRALRISGVGQQLLPMLARGATFGECEARLHDLHPAARDTSRKLDRFLDVLGAAGFLAARTGLPRGRAINRFALLSADGFARPLAGLLRAGGAVSWAVLALLLAGALAGLVLLAGISGLPRPLAACVPIEWRGIVAFVVVVVPLHEAGHAVACRLAGAPVGAVGVILHGWLVPGPYVDTTRAYRVRSRWRRAAIAGAGPIADLLGAGAAAWALLLLPHASAAHAAARTLLLLCLAILLLDLNPLGPSDGSRIIEAFMDDELARRSALSLRRAALSAPRDVTIYRVLCSLYAQALLAASVTWWVVS